MTKANNCNALVKSDCVLLWQTPTLEPIKKFRGSHLHVAGVLWVEAAILRFHVCESREVVGVDVGHVNLEKQDNTCLLIVNKCSYNQHLNNINVFTPKEQK